MVRIVSEPVIKTPVKARPKATLLLVDDMRGGSLKLSD